MKQFREVVATVLNLPWTAALLFAGLLSKPSKIELHRKPFAIVLHVGSFWYYRWVPAQKGVRAQTLGSTILLGPKLLPNDFEHELVHIEQHIREPLVHPFLNGIETLRHGYRQNKYEDEAYTTTNSTYVGHALD